jgi:hypothetical protein
MADELNETFAGPEVVIVPVETPTVDDAEDELDLVAEQVAISSIEDQERYEHILEEIAQCRSRLENLSASTMPESPILNQILSEILTIKVKVEKLESENRSRNTQSTPNTSNLPPSESTMTSTDQDGQEVVESTDDLNRPEPRVKRNRAI